MKRSSDSGSNSQREEEPAMRKLILVGVIAAGMAGIGSIGVTRGESAAATKIVYHSRLHGRNNEILVVSSAGGAPTRLTRNPASDSNPTWSPDGRRIAFESNRRGHRRYQDSDVYSMRADGSGVRELTFSNVFDGDPAWSSTNRIAFESDRTGNRDIWAVDADGSNEQQLTTSRAFDSDPAWSPDGSQIAFTSERDNGDREIYVMNADGTGQTRLTNTPGFDENPSWSPNGKKIAFESTRDGNLEIYVMNPDGTNQVRVTNHPALDALPSWSQDSKRIVFVSDRLGKGQRRLFTANVDGSGVRMLTHGSYDMSPDWARG
jgi:Tol biopolymer transport system component